MNCYFQIGQAFSDDIAKKKAPGEISESLDYYMFI